MHPWSALAASVTISAALLAVVLEDGDRQRASETARVKARLRSAYDRVSQQPVSRLSEDQRRRRAERLANLDAYIERGIFPKNTEVADARTPYFVDRSGTRCAVAHLVEESGRGDLVARISKTANNAYVSELAEDSELVAWLEENGLSAEEAAIIQPTYEPICFPKVDCICSHARAHGSSPEPSAIVHARVQQSGMPSVFTVLDVAGDAPGVIPGSELTLEYYTRRDVGAEVLLRLRRIEGSDQYDIILRVEDGQVPCYQIGEDLQVRIAMEALLAGDGCAEQVIDANSGFAGDHGDGCPGCRCSTAPARAPAMGLLFLFVAFLMSRKARLLCAGARLCRQDSRPRL